MWTSLQAKLRQWQSVCCQTSSAEMLVREEWWQIWERLNCVCLMTGWHERGSSPNQGKNHFLLQSSLTHGDQICCLSAHTGLAEWTKTPVLGSSMHTCQRECVHTSVWGRMIVYVGQRLNKGGKCVCLTLVISLNTQTEVPQVLVKLMQPCFLPFVGGGHICGQKHTQAAQEHTHHHCHTFRSEIKRVISCLSCWKLS